MKFMQKYQMLKFKRKKTQKKKMQRVHLAPQRHKRFVCWPGLQGNHSQKGV